MKIIILTKEKGNYRKGNFKVLARFIIKQKGLMVFTFLLGANDTYQLDKKMTCVLSLSNAMGPVFCYSKTTRCSYFTIREKED